MDVLCGRLSLVRVGGVRWRDDSGDMVFSFLVWFLSYSRVTEDFTRGFYPSILLGGFTSGGWHRCPKRDEGRGCSSHAISFDACRVPAETIGE